MTDVYEISLAASPRFIIFVGARITLLSLNILLR